ncbi:MAG: Glutamyl-tRNA(Gln) amidotransferase subunit A [Alphaproteobacteria bacterium MarineAlpha11_Bin1]|nr:MAG: Glutamyl-tRNA(Gln) amidotransferase subunit A [Alphaproteobacteria bacterium MarineAlpha11_Bin1]|tara:strand:+ start:4603 stop:5961 length:1359 start_codon:yes stop_codon:yes gene_type:complete
MDLKMKPVLELQAALWSGKTTSRELTEQALGRIKDPDGEGFRTFLQVHDEAALTAADASDAARATGVVPSPLAGIPVSLKDLFDEQGKQTKAGSKSLNDVAPAAKDSIVTARLRAAGAIIVGRTNLTEFAYSGLGLNCHYDTPRNPWDRKTGRIPGGSSSGAGVSVADGMCSVAIGTDTGGSVRIPSAVNGVTGFKTTTGRISLDGVYPLSSTLDSVGPLAPTVGCCVVTDAILDNRTPAIPAALPIGNLRFGIPQHYVLNDLDDQVAGAFEETIRKLERAGASVSEVPSKMYEEIPEAMPNGGILGAEAFAHHRDRMDQEKERYDPRVWVRIRRGENLSAADLIDCHQKRRHIQARAAEMALPFDALLMPTCPIIAPEIAPLDKDDELYGATNITMLRNTTVGNFLDTCALSIPCHAPGTGPVGLMVMAATRHDEWLVRIGLAVERTLIEG